MPDTNDPLYLLTTFEVQQLLGVGRARVFELIRTGELPSIALGTRRNGIATSRRIRRKAVEELQARWERETAEQLTAATA